MSRLLRYTLVGALATAAHYMLLVLGVEAFAWPAWVASGVGATLGAQLAYVGNRRFTFAHRGAIGTSWLRFQITALAGTLQGMAIVAAGVALGVNYLVAQIVATLAGLLTTFAINRAWTFG
jgi:putative flippase GtrA